MFGKPKRVSKKTDPISFAIFQDPSFREAPGAPQKAKKTRSRSPSKSHKPPIHPSMRSSKVAGIAYGKKGGSRRRRRTLRRK
jgi:hypothetical protein